MALPIVGAAARLGARFLGRAALAAAAQSATAGKLIAGRRGGPIRMSISPSPRLMMRRFGSARKSMADMSIPYRQSAIFLGQWVDHNFQTEGGSVGGWMPLKGGGRGIPGGGVDPSANILQDTGRLRASFETFATKRNAGVRSDLDYAPVHEEGLGHIPQRRMLPVKREVVRDVRDIFQRHVRRSLKKASWR